ncbi:MAG: TSUP family transporter [Actinomycetales bacterium]|nr:TSUP family transporter [Actinomycetales bacterium]
MIAEWTPLVLGTVIVAVFLYGISKTAMPVAGVLGGPLLAAALGATTASGFVMPLLLLGDLFALARYRQHANWPLIFKLIPGVLVGIVLTAVAFRYLETHWLDRLIGVLILTSVLLEVWRRRYPRAEEDRPPNRLVVGFFGTLAGVTTMAANAGGTAMTLYLINMRVSMLAFMGTFAWFFFVLNLLKVPFLVGLGFLNAQTLLADLWFVPVLVLGALIGYWLFRRMNEQVFTSIALGLSALASVFLIIHG